MMCQRTGLPPTSTIGLGRNSVSSRIRVPRPPASSTAFTRQARGNFGGMTECGTPAFPQRIRTAASRVQLPTRASDPSTASKTFLVPVRHYSLARAPSVSSHDARRDAVWSVDLVGAVPAEDGEQRLPQDLHVQGHRPVLDVVQVEAYRLVP